MKIKISSPEIILIVTFFGGVALSIFFICKEDVMEKSIFDKIERGGEFGVERKYSEEELDEMEKYFIDEKEAIKIAERFGLEEGEIGWQTEFHRYDFLAGVPVWTVKKKMGLEGGEGRIITIDAISGEKIRITDIIVLPGDN